MAIILSSLSLIVNPMLIQYDCYYDENKEKPISGGFTNMAPLEYLLKKSVKDGNTDIKVVCIVTREVFCNKLEINTKGNTEVFNCTTYKFYEKFIENVYKEIPGCNLSVEYIPFKFIEDDTDTEIDSKTAANNLFIELLKLNPNGENFYIDYTGAQRDTAYLMTSIIKYLKTVGAKISDIIYSNYDKDNKENNKICDIKYIHKLDELTEAVNDFINTGNVSELMTFFPDEDKYKKIRDLIEILKKYVHAISIGQIDKLDGIIIEIKDKLDCLDAESTDLYASTFYSLVPKIKESLYIGIDEKFGYPEIAKWCVNHRFIQQAVTIYVEKMPYEYINKGIGTFLDEINNKTEKMAADSSNQIHWFYTDLYQIFQRQDSVDVFVTKIQEKWNTSSEKNPEFLNNLTSDKDFSNEEKIVIKKLNKYIKEYSKDNEIRYGIERKQNDKCKHLNAIMGNHICLKCLWYGKNNANELPDYDNKNTSDEEKLLAVYRSKNRSVCTLLEKAKSNIEFEPLAQIMNYYLIVKIIRNQMNHSSIINENTKNIIVECIENTNNEELSSCKNDPMSYSSIKKILLQGIKITQCAVNPLITSELYENLLIDKS